LTAGHLVGVSLAWAFFLSDHFPFPYYLKVGGWRIHPHIFFEGLAYLVGFRVYLWLRQRFGDAVATPLRWVAIAAAVAGAALGSKILYWLEDPRLTWQNLHNPAYLAGGKTIVGALAFGLIVVEVVKRGIGMKQSTGDLYAIPLAVGIAIGRVGCFLTGLTDNTYGTPTGLPWGVDFGDGLRRHPTQIYEMVFLLGLIPVLFWIMRSIESARLEPFTTEGTEGTEEKAAGRRGRLSPHLSVFRPGDAFKFFMVAYLSFRLVCDFIKPYPRVWLGLGGIQWACVLVLLYYSGDIALWTGRAVPR